MPNMSVLRGRTGAGRRAGRVTTHYSACTRGPYVGRGSYDLCDRQIRGAGAGRGAALEFGRLAAHDGAEALAEELVGQEIGERPEVGAERVELAADVRTPLFQSLRRHR